MVNVNIAFTDICRGSLAGAGPAAEIAALQNMLDRASNDDELVNSTTENGYTALVIAFVFSRVYIVGFLLEKGADANQLDSHGYTPLMYAVANTTRNDSEVNAKHQLILQLLDYKADPNIASDRSRGFSSGITPMLIAIQKLGDKGIVQMLLRAGATDPPSMQCLQDACKQNRPDIVEELMNSPNLAAEDVDLPQNSFRNRAFCAAAIFLRENNMSAAFDIFNTHELPVNGDFITSFVPVPARMTLLHMCLNFPSNDSSRAQAVYQALEMGADPTHPIPLDDEAGTDCISPLAYALREPWMDLSSIFLLYRACSGLGPVSL